MQGHVPTWIHVQICSHIKWRYLIIKSGFDVTIRFIEFRDSETRSIPGLSTEHEETFEMQDMHENTVQSGSMEAVLS